MRKTGVGKIHSREKDATYTVDLVNGARKANIDDARECDPKLLEEEFQSEHGMVTHKDAYAEYHTENAQGGAGPASGRGVHHHFLGRGRQAAHVPAGDREHRARRPRDRHLQASPEGRREQPASR